MYEEDNPTNSDRTPPLIDFSILTNVIKVLSPWEITKRFDISENSTSFVSVIPHVNHVKVHTKRLSAVIKERCCDYMSYRKHSPQHSCVQIAVWFLLISNCQGRLFDNPHGNQRGILGGHGQPHPQFSGMGMLRRDQPNNEQSSEDSNYLADEERRRKMLKEYGVDGVVNVQDVGPDGKRRKKVRLGPIVFDPEAIRFDDLDDYNEHNDGPRSKIGRYDYDTYEDNIDRDRLVPSRNGGGLNIINKLIVSLYNFGAFLFKLFANLYRYMEKQIKLINDRMARDGDEGIPKMGRPTSNIPDSNKDEDHGETSLFVIVVASWIIFGIIVALVTYVVNYWSEFVVGNYDAQIVQGVSHEGRDNIEIIEGNGIKKELCQNEGTSTKQKLAGKVYLFNSNNPPCVMPGVTTNTKYNNSFYIR